MEVQKFRKGISYPVFVRFHIFNWHRALVFFVRHRCTKKVSRRLALHLNRIKSEKKFFKITYWGFLSWNFDIDQTVPDLWLLEVQAIWALVAFWAQAGSVLKVLHWKCSKQFERWNVTSISSMGSVLSVLSVWSVLDVF